MTDTFHLYLRRVQRVMRAAPAPASAPAPALEHALSLTLQDGEFGCMYIQYSTVQYLYVVEYLVRVPGACIRVRQVYGVPESGKNIC